MAVNYWIVLCYVVLLTYNISVESYRKEGAAEDIIATNVGIKIEKIGKIVSVFEDIIISVIIKLPNITGTGYQNGIAESRIDTCKDISWDFKRDYINLIQVTRLKTKEYISSRLEILQPFVTPTFPEQNNSARHKRGLLSFLGGGLISLAIGGISEYQIHKINQHVSENSEAINSIKQALYQEQAVIRSVNKKVVGFVNDITENLTRFYYEQTCSELYSALAIKFKHHFWDCRYIIDNTLWSALSGKNNLLLTPRTMNLNMLKNIVNEHAVLNNTIFQKHPSIMYSLAKLSLIEISDNLNFAHFVLRIPLISENEMLDLYQSAQVGMHLENNKCMYYDLPKHLYKIGRHFYPMSLEKCKKHNNLYICAKENFSNNSACFQQNYNDCKILKRNCYNYYEFDMSQVGILIRNNKENNTFIVDQKGWTTAVNLHKYRTAYLSWDNLKALQIGEILIDSPNMTYTPLTMSNLSLEDDIMRGYYTDGENITKVFNLICKKYNSTLDDILPPLVDHWQTQFKTEYRLNILWYIGTATIIAAIICWLIYLHYIIIKLNSRIQRINQDTLKMPYYASYKKLIKDADRNSI